MPLASLYSIRDLEWDLGLDASNNVGRNVRGIIASVAITALAVGPAGATNPTLQVDSSVASAATGIKVTGAAAAGGVAIAAISSGTNENLTIDAKGSGTITIGGTSTGSFVVSRFALFNRTLTPVPTTGDAGVVSVFGAGATDDAIDIHIYGADAAAMGIAFKKNRSATSSFGTHTVVQSGDELGYIVFRGSDGTSYRNAAIIEAFVDGTPGASDMPGRLTFSTTPDGSASLSERMRIDSNGTITIGGASNQLVAGYPARFQAHSIGNEFTGALVKWTADTEGALIALAKSRGTAIGTHTIVQSGDELGRIQFYGSNGSTYSSAGYISVIVDGTPGATNDMPGRMAFYTTPDGSGTSAERMRIASDSNGMVNIGIGGSAADAGYVTHWKGVGVVLGNSMIARLEQTSTGIAYAEYQAKTNAGVAVMGAQSTAAGATTYFGPTTSNMPLTLWTNSTERARISGAGLTYLTSASASTTATAANMFIDNASSPVGQVLRSTSSLRYKKDVEPVAIANRDAVLAINPIWYRSKSVADNPDHSFYGMAAEEVAAIDPRLVHWSYLDEDYAVVDEQLGTETVQRRVLKPGAKLVPEAVQYDRVAILQIAALKAKVAALEAKLSTSS